MVSRFYETIPTVNSFRHPRSRKILDFDPNYYFTLSRKIRIFQGFTLPLVKRTSCRWLKTGCWSATVTFPNRQNWYSCNCYVVFLHYFLVIVISLIFPFAGDYCHSKYALPASRVPVPTGGCKRLRLYSQLAISDQKALSASLMEAEASSLPWESEAKEAVERVIRAEVEKDDAHHEVSMARLDVEVEGSARAQVEFELAKVQHTLVASEDARHKGESELTRVQYALAASEEARRKTVDEANRLADKRVSLLLELGASKDELSAFLAKASKEKKALEEAFDAGFDVIFNYGYGCCAFAHNICRSEPLIPDGMSDTSKPLPLEFFINPRCPPGAAPRVPSTDADADVREAGKSFLAAEVGLGIQSYSPVGVTGENEEPDAFGRN